MNGRDDLNMCIKLYERNGKLKSTYKLIPNNFKNINGMLTRVCLKNGSSVEGYADPYRFKDNTFDDEVHDYIILWTFKDLDELTHKYNIDNGESIVKVKINDIKCVHSILYSNPRWGGKLTNKFFINTDI